jgi:hypothetical protein
MTRNAHIGIAVVLCSMLSLVTMAQWPLPQIPAVCTISHAVDTTASVFAEGTSDTLFWVFGGGRWAPNSPLYVRRIAGDCGELTPMRTIIREGGHFTPLKALQVGQHLYISYLQRLSPATSTRKVFVQCTDLLSPAMPNWVDSFAVDTQHTYLSDMVAGADGLYMCGFSSNTAFVRKLGFNGSEIWVRTWVPGLDEGRPSNLVLHDAELILATYFEAMDANMVRVSATNGAFIDHVQVPDIGVVNDMAITGDHLTGLGNLPFVVAFDLGSYSVNYVCNGYVFAQWHIMADQHGQIWTCGGNGDLCPSYGMTNLMDSTGTIRNSWFSGEGLDDMAIKADRIFFKVRMGSGIPLTNTLVIMPDTVIPVEIALGGTEALPRNLPALFPVPTADLLTVQWAHVVQYSILDAMGRDVTGVVSTSSASGDGTSLDVSRLTDGQYYVSGFAEGRSLHLPFVVMH